MEKHLTRLDITKIDESIQKIKSEFEFLNMQKGRMGRNNEDEINNALTKAKSKIQAAIALIEDAYKDLESIN